MQELLLIIISYIFIFLMYQLLIVRPSKSTKRKKPFVPVEVTYLEKRYKLNLKKVNYNQLLQIIAITSSFDITLVVSVIALVNNFFISILLAIVITVLSIIISYYFVYLFYKKKGMIKNV